MCGMHALSQTNASREDSNGPSADRPPPPSKHWTRVAAAAEELEAQRLAARVAAQVAEAEAEAARNEAAARLAGVLEATETRLLQQQEEYETQLQQLQLMHYHKEEEIEQGELEAYEQSEQRYEEVQVKSRCCLLAAIQAQLGILTVLVSINLSSRSKSETKINMNMLRLFFGGIIGDCMNINIHKGILLPN
jgi:hypothetical protein